MRKLRIRAVSSNGARAARLLHAAAMPGSLSTSTSYDDSAYFNSQSPGGFTMSRPNTAGGKLGIGLGKAGLSLGKGLLDSSLVQCRLLQKACFAAGTPIITPKGVRLIENLRAADYISCRPEEDPTAQVRVGMVDAVFELTAQIWELHVGGKVVETTAEHPFYLVGETRGEMIGWTPLCRLKPGDLLLGRGVLPMEVERVVQTNRTATVYNLRVEPDRTFFVGGDHWGFSLWVHNACTVNLNNNLAKSKFGVYKINVNGALYKIGKADLNRITKATGIPTRIHQQLVKLRAVHGERAVSYSLTSLGKTTTLKAKLAETAQLKAYYRATRIVPPGNAKSFFPEDYPELADLFT